MKINRQSGVSLPLVLFVGAAIVFAGMSLTRLSKQSSSQIKLTKRSMDIELMWKIVDIMTNDRTSCAATFKGLQINSNSDLLSLKSLDSSNNKVTIMDIDTEYQASNVKFLGVRFDKTSIVVSPQFSNYRYRTTLYAEFLKRRAGKDGSNSDQKVTFNKNLILEVDSGEITDCYGEFSNEAVAALNCESLGGRMTTKVDGTRYCRVTEKSGALADLSTKNLSKHMKDFKTSICLLKNKYQAAYSDFCTYNSSAHPDECDSALFNFCN